MNIKDLADKLEKKLNLSNTETQEMIEMVFQEIKNNLAAGEMVRIMNFGTFDTRHRKARKCRNPKSGEYVDIVETLVPLFRPSISLKGYIKKKNLIK